MNKRSLSKFSASVAMILMAGCSGGGSDNVAQSTDAGRSPAHGNVDAPAAKVGPKIVEPMRGAPDEIDRIIFDSKDIVKTDLCSIRMNEISLSGLRATEADDKASVWFEGWFGDEDTMSWPDSASLYVQRDGPKGRVWEVKLSEQIPRGDVARKFRAETMRNTGFKVESNLSALPAGNYRLIPVFNKGQQQHRCDRGRIIRLN